MRQSLPRRPGQEEWAARQRGPTDQFQTFHVNGTMPTARREREMRDFREAARAIMSNARCLTEGVDVPAVDMVAFLSPRRSRVDIVQATGRAMRRSPGKTTGYVLVPLYVELAAGETVEAAVNRAEFDEVWDVLQAMQEQDEVLAEIIREMREERGRTKGFDDACFRDKVDILGPAICVESLRMAIATACVDKLGVSWDEYFGQLKLFQERFKHCAVPAGWVENPALANWVANQRQKKRLEELNAYRESRLNEIGFVWQPFDEAWEVGFSKLVEYKQRHGDCNVRRGPAVDRDLANWVHSQRRYREFLSEEQIARLNELGFTWNRFDASWEGMFSALKKYKQTHGDCNVPVGWSENRRLAGWVQKQREAKKSGMLSQVRVACLESEDFIWDLLVAAWEEMFGALMQFKLQCGHCDVPARWPGNIRLATWVQGQRRKKRRGQLGQEYVKRLDELGFGWGTANRQRRATAKQMLAALAEYKQRHGDCNVPQRWQEDRALATWVSNQRRSKKEGRMGPKRIRELELLGFVWEIHEVARGKMLDELVAYKCKHGNCDVPTNSPEHRKLGFWVAAQRRAKKQGTMSQERIEQLDEIGFRWGR